MPAQPELVETPLGGGLMTGRTADAHIPFGELTIAKNIRQTKNGLLAKRPGNSKLTNQFQQLYNVGPANLDVSKGGALAAFGNQLLVHCNAGMSSYSAAHGTFGTFKPCSEALLRRSGLPLPSAINVNATNSVLFSMAPTFITDGSHNFYLWIDNFENLFLTIQNASSGAIIQDRVGIEPGVSNIIWAVPLLLGTQLTICYLKSTGALLMVTMAAPYTGLVSGSTTLNTGVGTAGNFDAVVVNANLFAVAEIVATTGVTVKTFNAAGTPVGSIAAPIAATNPSDVRLDYNATNAQLWMAWNTNGVAVFVQDFVNLGSVTITSPMTGPFSVDTNPIKIHVVAWANNQVVVAYTRSNNGATMAALVDGTLSANAGGFVIQSNTNAASSCRLASKPFVQGGRAYAWVQMLTPSPNNAAATEWGASNPVQFTNVLVDLRMDTGTNGTLRALRPVAVDSPRFAYPRPDNSLNDAGVNSGAKLSPLPIVQVSPGVWTTLFGVRQTAYETAWSRVDASFVDPARWHSSQLGNLLLTSSGMIENYDGACSFENGFLNHVAQPTLAQIAGGFLTASATYWYRVVPVAIDTAGNVHRGIPSALASFALDASHHAISLTWLGLQITDRMFQDGSSVANLYAMYWEIYRSQPNPASAGSDIATNLIDIIPNGEAATFTYNDALVSDTQASKNALCYTFGGALPNGCPPGALDIVVHQGRAWALADDGKNWYYTKQVVDGEAVNFTDGFTQPADDFDGVGGASMDDKLIAFTRRKIFYQVGFGPGDNGQQSDYQGFVRIQSPVGCIDRRSVVSTPDGVYFQSPIGIYLLTRGLEVVYVGQPVQDELNAFPVVVAAILHPTQPWVYFYVTNVAGNAGERLVYDYRVQKWYTDTLPGVPVSAASTSDGTHYWLDTTGQVWQEAPTTPGASCLDNGAYVVSDWETVEHAVGIDGWQNLARVQVLFYRNSPHDLKIQTRPMYGTTYDTPSKDFNDVALSAMSGYLGRAGQVGQVEIVPQSSKVNAIAIRITDAAPTGGAALGTGQGPSFFALAALTQPEPATLALVSDTQRGPTP